MNEIRAIELPVTGSEDLRAEARKEGYDFIETLVIEWASGQNRFDGVGEMLCGYFEGDEVIAVGGLTIDPFVGSPDVGRVRRVYVRPSRRRLGIGRALVEHLVAGASSSFRVIRLRAENEDAARLYERIGFEAIDDPNATHMLILNRNSVHQ